MTTQSGGPSPPPSPTPFGRPYPCSGTGGSLSTAGGIGGVQLLPQMGQVGTGLIMVEAGEVVEGPLTGGPGQRGRHWGGVEGGGARKQEDGQAEVAHGTVSAR